MEIIAPSACTFSGLLPNGFAALLIVGHSYNVDFILVDIPTDVMDNMKLQYASVTRWDVPVYFDRFGDFINLTRYRLRGHIPLYLPPAVLFVIHADDSSWRPTSECFQGSPTGVEGLHVPPSLKPLIMDVDKWSMTETPEEGMPQCHVPTIYFGDDDDIIVYNSLVHSAAIRHLGDVAHNSPQGGSPCFIVVRDFDEVTIASHERVFTYTDHSVRDVVGDIFSGITHLTQEASVSWKSDCIYVTV